MGRRERISLVTTPTTTMIVRTGMTRVQNQRRGQCHSEDDQRVPERTGLRSFPQPGGQQQRTSQGEGGVDGGVVPKCAPAP